jgi:tryptophan synthase beta chain
MILFVLTAKNGWNFFAIPYDAYSCPPPTRAPPPQPLQTIRKRLIGERSRPGVGSAARAVYIVIPGTTGRSATAVKKRPSKRPLRLTAMHPRRVLLGERELPSAWYNLAADLPDPPALLLHPATREPLRPEDLAAILPRALVEQEWSRQRWIDIPDPVRQALALWRPTPLVRALELERALRTPARIYFKDESRSPPGSHKPNTAVAQAYYCRQEGAERLVTETGAGQWGCSLALACGLLGLECQVFMVNLSYRQRPYRASMMRLWGAEVVASPSERTEAGRRVRRAQPDSPGSLGIAISEAVETAARDHGAKYAMGSILNHVLLHQTVIGLEAEKQMALAGDQPDVVIGCIGGGSNFAGLAFPYLRRKLAGSPVRLLAAEPAACPSLTRGLYRYDYTDTAAQTPLVKMFTLGHGFMPPSVQAGGLRYHGVAPLVSQAAQLGLIEAAAFDQLEAFEAARLFAATEGVIPAIETSYALRAAVVEAERCRETGQPECILVCLSGHGLCELGGYDQFLAGKLDNPACSQQDLEAALAELPDVGDLRQ